VAVPEKEGRLEKRELMGGPCQSEREREKGCGEVFSGWCRAGLASGRPSAGFLFFLFYFFFLFSVSCFVLWIRKTYLNSKILILSTLTI
jgi:hypothetical protein